MRWTLLFASSLAFAQVDKANLTGVVTDPSGGVVPGVSVRIEAAATGFTRVAETSDSGAYNHSHVPIGEYIVTFSKAGFQPARFEKIALRVGQTRMFDATLRISATTSEIVVTDTPPALQTNNAEISLAFGEEQMRSLPLNGRNWTSFLMLAPGATNSGDGSQNSVRFLGRSRDDNNFTFDGVDATGVKDPRQEANLRLNISLDSIAEFRVSSGLYNAESGNGAGAQMNLVSKSGTNTFHASAFEFFRNDKLDARRPIDAAKPPFRLNQFGGNAGGRIIKDKTFYFANYEGLRQRLAQTFINTVPSAAYKARVSAASPVLKPVMDAYKPGTARTSNADQDQLVSAASQPWTENSGLIKVDHRFSDKTSFFARYNIDNGTISELRNVLLETRVSNFRTQNGVIQLQRLFSTNVLAETRLGVNRSALRRDTNGTFNEGVSIPGFVSLQVDRTEVEIGTSYSLNQSLAWTKGSHNFKFGGEYRKIDLVLSDTGQITTSFASRDTFVLNRADSVSFGSALPGVKGLRPYYFLFAQDEWKVSRAITLSIGTRYEYYSVAKTSDGRGRVLDLGRCNGFCAAGTPWYFADRNNWAPRAGMAWARNKSVVRVGYGIFYGPGQIDDVNAPIDSIPETYSLTARDQPALAFPANTFIAQARSTGVSARAVQRDRRDGYSQQWTVSLQQQLPFAMVAQAAYLGGNGHQLFGRSFINTIDPATGRRPYPGFSNIDIKTNDANSSMNALQMSLQRSLKSGFQWQTQYMWSHNISDNAGAGDGQNIMISSCRACDRGNADWDIRHTMTTNASYELPTKFLRGGWSVSGIATARTGLPFSATVNRAAADLPDGVAATPGRGAPAQRPDFVPGQPFYTSSPSAGGWLNAAAFRAPARGTWGNLPRNALRGPGLWQVDMSLGKRTSITERMNVEFRAEAFNLFNRAQYGNPSANISNPAQFGLITGVINANPTGFGGPRQIQLMLRLNY
jgi:hypothetical protein